MMELMPSGPEDSGKERLQEALRKGAKGAELLKSFKTSRKTALVDTTTKMQVRREPHQSNQGDAEIESTQVLASMVPDEIIYHGDDYRPSTFVTALMFGDISGFTDLSERYNSVGGDGASKLSHVLNLYMGNMIQEILSHGGDILKFSGDAFLVIFKTSPTITMQQAVREAIDTSLIIQKNYGRYVTDVGIVLRVKMGISGGQVFFSPIGSERVSHYIVVGQPILDVKAAERVCEPGDITVAINAWKHINNSEYKWYAMENKRQFKVTGFSDSWRSLKRYDDSLADSKSDGSDSKSGQYSLRPCINIAIKDTVQKYLRRYMIPPLMRAIDTNEPIEFLTEIRQAVIVFLNLVINQEIPILSMMYIIDESYKTICDIAEFYDGFVNKVSLFDKDVTFLIIFGLRGFKHSLESRSGLRCATEIHAALSGNERKIHSVSVGVTSGSTYCGVVGHVLRREYTAISMTVNKAARLMTAYVNKVTCDRETFLDSKISSSHFSLLPLKELKGLADTGPIYEFHQMTSILEINFPIKSEYDLLGRANYMHLFYKLTVEALDKYRSIMHTSLEKNVEYNDETKTCLLLLGDTQHGKSRLLDEMFFETYKRKLNCIRITLNMTQGRKPYSTAQIVIYRCLGFVPSMTMNDREFFIAHKMRSYNVGKFLYVLNPLLDVAFHESGKMRQFSPADVEAIKRKMFRLFSQACFENFWVLIVDDIEYSDVESFEFFCIMLDTYFVYSVFSMGSSKRSVPIPDSFLKHKRLVQKTLTPISQMYHSALACQFLHVAAITIDLERVIHTKSDGNPGWIKNFLLSLQHGNAFHLKIIPLREAIDLGLVINTTEPPPPPDVEPHGGKEADMASKWEIMNRCYRQNNITKIEASLRLHQRMATNTDSIHTAMLDPLFDIVKQVGGESQEYTLHLIKYDSLSHFDQLVCKCASVLGENISRVMLLYVLTSTYSERSVALVIQRLFEKKILMCCGGNFEDGPLIYHKILIQEPEEEQNDLRCTCVNLKTCHECDDLPRYANCGYFRFYEKEFAETILNLLTNKQKTEFHVRALIFLETETKRCEACGGGYFDNFIITHDTSCCLPKNELQDIQGKRKSMIKTQTEQEDLTESPNVLDYISFELSQCECKTILYSIYAQIVEHCFGAGLTLRIIEILIEFANICIKVRNIPKALSLLNDTEKRLAKMDNFDTVLRAVLTGRIYTLRGECLLSMNQVDEAFEMHQSALNYMGHNRTCSKWSVKLCSIYIRKWKYVNFEPMNNCDVDSLKFPGEILLYEQICDCLMQKFKVQMAHKKWLGAEKVALEAMNIAVEENFSDFGRLLQIFGGVLQISCLLGRIYIMDWLQNICLRLICLKQTDIGPDNLSVVLEVYIELIASYRITLKKKMAIRMAYQCTKLTIYYQNITLLLKTIPSLIDMLFEMERFNDALAAILYLKFKTLEVSSMSTLTWTNATSLDYALVVGEILGGHQECFKYFYKNLQSPSIVKEPYSLGRFYGNMWLIAARKMKWDDAQFWDKIISSYFVLKKTDSIVHLFSATRILEAMLLTLAHLIETKNKYEFDAKMKQIDKLMQNIEVCVKVKNNYLGRLQFYKGYLQKMLNPKKKNLRLFKSARSQLIKEEDLFFMDFVNHNLYNWYPRYFEDTENADIVFFLLPLPETTPIHF